MNLPVADARSSIVSAFPLLESSAIPVLPRVAGPGEGDLQRILAAGLEAPLAGGRRGWHFVVTRDPGHCLRLLASAGASVAMTPSALVAVIALEAPWRRHAERLLREAGRCRDFAAAAVRSGSLAAWLERQARESTGAMATTTRSLGWQARVHTHLDAAVIRRALRLRSAVAFAALVTIGPWLENGPAGQRLSAAAR